MVVRAGIGLGIVLDGRIRTSVRGLAGILGYSYVSRGKETRRMTDIASSMALVREALGLVRRGRRTPRRNALLRLGSRATLADVVRAAEAGESDLSELLASAGRDLGLLAVNLTHTFSPERLILAGEVTGCSALLRRPLEETFYSHLISPLREAVTLVDSETGELGAALGGAFLAFSRLYPSDSNHLGDWAIGSPT